MSACRIHVSTWIRSCSSSERISAVISSTGSPSLRGDRLDVGAAVAVLRRLLSTPPRLDRLAEEVDLATDVVVVVLALDVVPGELEQPRDGVAVGAVSRRGRP